jgi:periplasmic protein TonB
MFDWLTVASFGWISLAGVLVAAGIAWRNTHRDMAIGMVFSFIVFAGIYWVGEWAKPGPKAPPKEEAPTVQLMEMPKLEPDEPDVVDDTDQKTNPVDLAPPMQTDVPQAVTSMFVQQVEPPPPDMSINKNALKVPENVGNWKNGMQVFDISMLDQIPEATFRPSPQYPYDMRRTGTAGTFTVDFIVDTECNVINAYAISSTQHDFEANAVAGISRWKFRPGKKGGHVVATHMQIPIQFTLDSGQ